jgi:signal transduction histidine kinase/regulator of replication initiation timing
MLERISSEKAQVEAERDAMTANLKDIEGQLGALGVSGGVAGLAQMVAHVYEERAALQLRAEQLQRERVDAAIQAELEKQVHNLRSELTHVATDREALIKQRDRLRAERDELVERQEAMKAVQTRLVAEAAAFEQELREAYDEQQTLRTQLQGMQDERSTLMSERDHLQAQLHALQTERDQVLARIEGDRDRLQQLGEDGVGALTRMIEELTAQRAQSERELNDARMQLAALQGRMDMLQIRSGAAGPAYRTENPDALLGLVQELRTPMTSIVGYVDLLLNESAGILGEMQRRFLQRISTNVSRLTHMLDDLIQLSFLDAGRYTLNREPIDIVELVEDAVTSAANALREKGLTVHLDIDDEVPLVQADREAMSQVVGQLLTNAYLVSPPGTDVYLSVQRTPLFRGMAGDETSPAQNLGLLISVEDRGGGIALEDQARVFARKYKAENPLVQGLGDTGVGLAITKALVEAHGGDMWLETREHIGSVFHVRLAAVPPETASDLATANQEPV